MIIPYIGNNSPVKGSTHAAAYDLVACKSYILYSKAQPLLVDCGLKIAIPEGYCGLLLPRSGLALKYGITVLNSPGLIDSDYRGPVKALLINHGPTLFRIEKGDRVAQLLIVKHENVEWEQTDVLPDSERMEGGWGSSGLKS